MSPFEIFDKLKILNQLLKICEMSVTFPRKLIINFYYYFVNKCFQDICPPLALSLIAPTSPTAIASASTTTDNQVQVELVNVPSDLP